jgi:hypothetical protein
MSSPSSASYRWGMLTLIAGPVGIVTCCPLLISWMLPSIGRLGRQHVIDFLRSTRPLARLRR